MTTAEQITDVCTYHGEGPIWDAAAGRVRWVDMLRGEILSMPPGGGPIIRRRVGEIAGSMRTRAGGGLVVGIERGFALLDDAEGGEVRRLPEVWADPGIRMNDGGCDPQGRYYSGSMAYDKGVGRAALYRLDTDLSVSTVLRGVTISNGLVWSLDGGTAYYVDSPTGQVTAFRFDAAAGTFHDGRPVIRVDPASGSPDGMTIDAEGGLWVAVWGGGAVHRYLPDGRLDEVIELPARQVSACTFGGPELDQLFITTSREDLPDDVQPLAGALFRARPGVRGRPTPMFAG